MVALPRNPKAVCATQLPKWDVYYHGEHLGVVTAVSAYDAKRAAESDFDIDDVCFLIVSLQSGGK